MELEYHLEILQKRSGKRMSIKMTPSNVQEFGELTNNGPQYEDQNILMWAHACRKIDDPEGLKAEEKYNNPSI